MKSENRAEGAAVGQPVEPSPVKLIMAVILAQSVSVPEVRTRIEASYGAIDLSSAMLPFDATHYYEREMGPHLHRMLWSFQTLISPEALAEIKRATNALERAFACWDGRSRRRRVNLDPGYVDLAKLVLATTKDRQHRLYLGQGIYAEVTLRFTGGHFIPWEWTYPDYRSPEYLTFFEAVRRCYRQQQTARLAEARHV